METTKFKRQQLAYLEDTFRNAYKGDYRLNKDYDGDYVHHAHLQKLADDEDERLEKLERIEKGQK